VQLRDLCACARTVTQWMKVMELLQINVNVERELLNHRPLLHAHIIRFREVPP
jgi:hypothetical protein